LPATTASRSRGSRTGRVNGACTANASASSSSVMPAFAARRRTGLVSPWRHIKRAIDTAGIIATAKSIPPGSEGPLTLAQSDVV
jgi:hypothetical protein